MYTCFTIILSNSLGLRDATFERKERKRYIENEIINVREQEQYADIRLFMKLVGWREILIMVFSRSGYIYHFIYNSSNSIITLGE